MGTQFVIAISAVSIALTLLALLGRKSVRAVLTVQGTPAEVWSVIGDPASYFAWNPVVVSVKGAFAEGATLAVEMKNPDGSTSVFESRVAQVVPHGRLNQVGGIPGLLTFDHTWWLEAVDGGTKVTQYEVYRGIGVLFLDCVWIEAAYRRALIQLRDLVESRSRRQPHIEHRMCSASPEPRGPSIQIPSPAHADRNCPY